MNKTPMIPRTEPAGQTPSWQQALAQAIRDPAELLELLALPKALLPAAKAASQLFPLRVPQSYVQRMQAGNVDDPLLRQVLPLGEETEFSEGFHTDPVGDRQAMVAPGVLHKYQGRVLLTVTGACAVHCRYCFRRHYPYTEANPAGQSWQATIDYLQAHDDVHEVILSGGDPLSLSDKRLAQLLYRLSEVPHLKRLRWHSRLPVMIPERLTSELLSLWQDSPLQQVLVLHFNHPAEINETVRRAIQPLRQADITLLNQSVLLKGVNDDADTLAALSVALLSLGVLPYYLHLLDRTQGVAHFEVESQKSVAIYQSLLAKLPGYLVPKLVRDIAGAEAKINIRI